MNKLDRRKTEKINSCGPFNHSHWEGYGISVSNEEGLAGRADFLAKKIRKAILHRFSRKELKHMTIADMGCYDGWILHILSDLPFKRLVGIEPRSKNIQKGKRIRRLLNIKSRVETKLGSLERPGKEKFDIVLCIGVLHHVESVSQALKQLNSITKKFLVVDTISMPSTFITPVFEKAVEMKDVIYRLKSGCGLTAQKYESAYYDGSTSFTTVVSIPTQESVNMYLNALGYQQIRLEAGPTDFRSAMRKNKRHFDEILVSAIKPPGKNNLEDETHRFVKGYEQGLLEKELPPGLILELYRHICDGERSPVSPLALSAIKYVKGLDAKNQFIKKFKVSSPQLEIARNLRFNAKDKIAFEYGKFFFRRKKYEESAKILERLVGHINADWRSTYRSFYLLSELYKKLGNARKSAYYRRLCEETNPNYPLLHQ